MGKKTCFPMSHEDFLWWLEAKASRSSLHQIDRDLWTKSEDSKMHASHSDVPGQNCINANFSTSFFLRNSTRQDLWGYRSKSAGCTRRISSWAYLGNGGKGRGRRSYFVLAQRLQLYIRLRLGKQERNAASYTVESRSRSRASRERTFRLVSKVSSSSHQESARR